MWLDLLVCAIWIIRIYGSSPTDQDWTDLNDGLTGYVVSSTDSGFIRDDFMTWYPFNYPFLSSSHIIFAETDQDVVESVKFFNKFTSLDFRIRSGANSLGGYSKCNGCTALDLNLLKDITTIIGKDSEPYLSVQPGVDISEFTAWEDSDDNEYHRMLPHGDCPMVHFGGYSQGGGENTIMSQYGWTVDYLLGVRIVLADGGLYDVFYSEDIMDNLNITDEDVTSKVDPDLIYALRGGGGGNFGVVTAYYFETLPLIDALVYAEPAYAVVANDSFINHLNYFNTFLSDSFTSGDVHNFRVILNTAPQTDTTHFPYGYAVQYTFFYVNPFAANQTKMLQQGKELINAFVDGLDTEYGYEPVEPVQFKIYNYTQAMEVSFPFWLQFGYPEYPLPTWVTSRLITTNSIAEDTLEEIGDYFWDYILSGKIQTDQIAPSLNWQLLAVPENDDVNISLSYRYSQGMMSYVPLPTVTNFTKFLTNIDTFKTKMYELCEEFLTDILDDISTVTFINYMDSFSTELSNYYEPEILESLQTIKCNVDPDNLFSFEVGIECDDEEPTTTADQLTTADELTTADPNMSAADRKMYGFVLNCCVLMIIILFCS